MTNQEDEMARMAAVRSQYESSTITTTPERLVTMLYDRLVRDLVAAEQAIEDGDRERVNDELVHAQAIVLELLTSLDTSSWSGGTHLSALYVWLLEQLVQANVKMDRVVVAECRALVEPIGDAWHDAAAQMARSSIHLAPPVQAVGGAM